MSDTPGDDERSPSAFDFGPENRVVIDEGGVLNSLVDIGCLVGIEPAIEVPPEGKEGEDDAEGFRVQAKTSRKRVRSLSRLPSFRSLCNRGKPCFQTS